MILDTALIDRNIDKIGKKSRQITPRCWHAAVIVAGFEEEHTVQFSDSNMTKFVSTMESIPAVCRVAKARTIPPNGGAPVVVQTEEKGTYMVETTPTKNDGIRLSVAKGIMLETLPH